MSPPPAVQAQRQPLKAKLEKPALALTFDPVGRVVSKAALEREEPRNDRSRFLITYFGETKKSLVIFSQAKLVFAPSKKGYFNLVILNLSLSYTSAFCNPDGQKLDFSGVMSLRNPDLMAVSFDQVYYDEAAFYFGRKGVYEVNLSGPNPDMVAELELKGSYEVKQRELIVKAVRNKNDWVYSFRWARCIQDSKDYTDPKDSDDSDFEFESESELFSLKPTEVKGEDLEMILLGMTSQMVPVSQLRLVAKELTESSKDKVSSTNCGDKNCQVPFVALGKMYQVQSTFGTKPNRGKRTLLSV